MRILNPLAYETLILKPTWNIPGMLGWVMMYGFANALLQTTQSWAIIDPTLWNLAFSGKATATCCKFCFSLSHGSSDCAWATDQPTSHSSTSSGTFSHPIRICYAWNSHPQAGCPYLSCTYEHICTFCSKDPSIIDKCHKAVFCPRHPRANNGDPCPTLASPQLPQPYQHHM